MSDILIIAPTHTYKRGANRKEINDTIKDYSDARRTSQKLNTIIPKGAIHTIAECKTAKIYLDPRPIETMEEHQKQKSELMYEMDDLYAHHPMTNVSLPVMDGTNNKFIKGMSNT
jgi:hypothetical protein